ncbi:MAG: hypothetical protein Q7T59_02620 [Candidatus Woesebacteria bacterium]|nr:hypothetical protein [Candidatus Woesebacteria bacterium]
MLEDKKGDHSTCTSSPIANELGYHPEHLPREVLDQLYKKHFGTEVSTDPVVARIQREQALVKDKRSKNI